MLVSNSTAEKTANVIAVSMGNRANKVRPKEWRMRDHYTERAVLKFARKNARRKGFFSQANG
jgi:hypothetical protein